MCACVAERPRVERAFDQTRLGAHVLVKASLASLSPDPCFDTAYCQDRALRRCLAPADACRHDCRCVCALLHVTLWSAGAQNVGRRQLQCVHERISMMCVHKHTAECTNGTQNITTAECTNEQNWTPHDIYWACCSFYYQRLLGMLITHQTPSRYT